SADRALNKREPSSLSVLHLFDTECDDRLTFVRGNPLRVAHVLNRGDDCVLEQFPSIVASIRFRSELLVSSDRFQDALNPTIVSALPVGTHEKPICSSILYSLVSYFEPSPSAGSFRVHPARRI